MRLLARAVLISRFEQVEGNIWKSQVDMLMHLDAIATGDAPGRLKEQFYDKAAARFPDVFAAYSFEGYLGFLRNFTLVVIQANSIEISQEGREYLAWRLEQSRPPKVAG